MRLSLKKAGEVPMSTQGHEVRAAQANRLSSQPPDLLEVGLESDVCAHICSISAVMVGACLTVIGLLRIVVTIQQVNTWADDILAFTSVLFLCSCLCAYWAMRSRGIRRMKRLEHVADVLFIIGMVLSVAGGIFVTYAFSAWAA